MATSTTKLTLFHSIHFAPSSLGLAQIGPIIRQSPLPRPGLMSLVTLASVGVRVDQQQSQSQFHPSAPFGFVETTGKYIMGLGGGFAQREIETCCKFSSLLVSKMVPSWEAELRAKSLAERGGGFLSSVEHSSSSNTNTNTNTNNIR